MGMVVLDPESEAAPLAETTDAAPAAGAAPVQVLFYGPEAAEFAFAWQAAAPASRWQFQVSAAGPAFLGYLCMRLQQLGISPAQVLIATGGGGGAYFYTVPGAVSPSSPGAVGLLPRATPPADFGSTLQAFAPGATLTLLTGATAGDQIFEGNEYRGADLLGQLAAYLGGWVIASDQVVSWNSDGTASTLGNLWAGDPATGAATLLRAAPAGGGGQNFPLDPDPARG